MPAAKMDTAGDYEAFLRVFDETLRTRPLRICACRLMPNPWHQGRYKPFPVETDEHFYRVVRYVHRNALRCGLVPRAEQWPWSSAASASDATVTTRIHP